MADPQPSQAEKSARVRNVVSKWDHDADNRRDYDRQEVTVTKNSDQLTTFRRVMEADDDKSLDYEELDVESDGLRELLALTLDHMPPEQFDAGHVKFLSPFKELVWQWHKLEQAQMPKPDDTEKLTLARQDLKDAMALIKSSESLDNYFNSLSSHRAGSTVAFAHLWSLFEPGTLIYHKAYNSEMQLFEVQSVWSENEQGLLFVDAAAFDWNGDSFLRYCYRFVIPKFEGARSILNLPFYPASHYHTEDDPTGSQLWEKLLERGKLFHQICVEDEFQYDYEGPMLYPHQDPYRDTEDIMAYLSGKPRAAGFGFDHQRKTQVKFGQLNKSKVIVDNYSYLNSRRNPDGGKLPLGHLVGTIGLGGGCVCGSCNKTVTVDWAREAAKHVTKEARRMAFAESDERLRMCPPKVLGYTLLRRHWAQLSVNHVVRIASRTADDFEMYFRDNLEMDPAQKKLLKVGHLLGIPHASLADLRLTRTSRGKAMITYHVSPGEKRVIADVVEGKGQGLVILLHGPPGVGKTLTAETVALATAKPLLSVSTAEIGMEPNEAERNFTAIFEDASRWKAVLLMYVLQESVSPEPMLAAVRN